MILYAILEQNIYFGGGLKSKHTLFKLFNIKGEAVSMSELIEINFYFCQLLCF